MHVFKTCSDVIRNSPRPLAPLGIVRVASYQSHLGMEASLDGRRMRLVVLVPMFIQEGGRLMMGNLRSHLLQREVGTAVSSGPRTVVLVLVLVEVVLVVMEVALLVIL